MKLSEWFSYKDNGLCDLLTDDTAGNLCIYKLIFSIYMLCNQGKCVTESGENGAYDEHFKFTRLGV